MPVDFETLDHTQWPGLWQDQCWGGLGPGSGFTSLWNVQFHMQKSLPSVSLGFPYLQNQGLSMTLEHAFVSSINPQVASPMPTSEAAA